MTNLSFPSFFVIFTSLFAEGQYALAVGWVVAGDEVEGLLRLLHRPGMGDGATQVDLPIIDHIDDLLELTVLEAAATHVELL